MKKISIIIPVYNGGAYIKRCLNSVLEQRNFSLKDLDIIVVNDGSTDNSLEIVRAYEKKNQGIVRVIDQENSGVAKTRNKAVELAKGKYLMFIDQDDWVDCDYCAIFYRHIETSKSDVVVGGYIRPDAKGKIIKKQILSGKSAYDKYVIMAAWAKIHRTKFVIDNNIKFFQGSVGEDSIFTVAEAGATERITSIDYAGYNWFYNDKSVSNTSQKSLTSQLADDLVVLVKKLCDVGDGSDEFRYLLLKTITFYMLHAGRRSNSELLLSTSNRLFASVEIPGLDIYKTRWLPFGPASEAMSVRVVVLSYILLHRLKLMKYFTRVYCVRND